MYSTSVEAARAAAMGAAANAQLAEDQRYAAVDQMRLDHHAKEVTRSTANKTKLLADLGRLEAEMQLQHSRTQMMDSAVRANPMSPERVRIAPLSDPMPYSVGRVGSAAMCAAVMGGVYKFSVPSPKPSDNLEFEAASLYIVDTSRYGMDGVLYRWEPRVESTVGGLYPGHGKVVMGKEPKIFPDWIVANNGYWLPLKIHGKVCIRKLGKDSTQNYN